jgi:Sel1 repeat
MRLLLMLLGATLALAEADQSVIAKDDILGMFGRAPLVKKSTLAEANVWFEQALALDLGISGSPNAVQAFTAMRRAADAGHELAAFNVAAMLDSGRGVPRDVAQAAIWYARAAARGNQRAAFNLGQLYERGEGVPPNFDLSRAWYASSDLPAGRERLARLKQNIDRPDYLHAPQPLSPQNTLVPESQQAELIWTSPLEPEPVRFFVELRTLDALASHEAWSGFVDVSSVRLPLPPGAQMLAWRVTAVATNRGDYATSPWSVFSALQR